MLITKCSVEKLMLTVPCKWMEDAKRVSFLAQDVKLSKNTQVVCVSLLVSWLVVITSRLLG